MNHRSVLLHVVLLATFVALAPGCQSTGSRSPYAQNDSIARNPTRAHELTQQALGFMADDLRRAEQILRDALVADLYHGPAHNNLGVIHLGRGELYEAASEFEWARKLMPGHPDPRLNLGLALERAGKIDDALNAYAAALDTMPGHLPSIQALARAQLRHNRQDDRTREMLEMIAFRSSEQWRRWARTQLAIRQSGV